MAFKSYHHVWLSAHPHRSPEWLAERLAEGFDIHHVNGDHGDDAPDNLVLIECADHMRLHGRPNVLRIANRDRKKRVIIRRYQGGQRRNGRSIVAEYYVQIARGERDGRVKPIDYPPPAPVRVDDFSGPELKRWRKHMGLTIAEASGILEVSPAAFSRWEKEGAKKSVALACLAISHGVPPLS